MTNSIAPIKRSGQSDADQGTEQTHTLIIYVHDRPGSVDRVVSLLRRRRANMQTLVVGRSEAMNVVRMTVVVTDSEVGIDQLTEQFRKIVDVQRVINLTEQQAIMRVLALIKVNSTEANFNAIIDCGLQFGARALDITRETVTLEIVGSEEHVENLVSQLQAFGIREIVRSGSVAIQRGL